MAGGAGAAPPPVPANRAERLCAPAPSARRSYTRGRGAARAAANRRAGRGETRQTRRSTGRGHATIGDAVMQIYRRGGVMQIDRPAGASRAGCSGGGGAGVLPPVPVGPGRCRVGSGRSPGATSASPRQPPGQPPLPVEPSPPIRRGPALPLSGVTADSPDAGWRPAGRSPLHPGHVPGGTPRPLGARPPRSLGRCSNAALGAGPRAAPRQMGWRDAQSFKSKIKTPNGNCVGKQHGRPRLPVTRCAAEMREQPCSPQAAPWPPLGTLELGDPRMGRWGETPAGFALPRPNVLCSRPRKQNWLQGIIRV